MDDFDKVFADKQTIMVVMAHPDDLEVFAGGTVARLIKSGKRVVSVKMTAGEKGSRDQDFPEEKLKATRKEEDSKSMEILGIKPEDSVILDLGDGNVNNNLDTIEKLAELVRKFKPDLVITHNPEHVVIRYAEGENWINHRDHRHTGQSTIDAVYPYSRDTNFFPGQQSELGLSGHTCSQFLLVDYYEHPDLVHIDVTEYLDQRINSLASHASQFSPDRARSMSEFLTDHNSGKRMERFRYVVAD